MVYNSRKMRKILPKFAGEEGHLN